MLNTQAIAATGSSYDLSRRARAQLMMLIVQFLLGIGVTLIGLPSETTGMAKLVTIVSLIGHIVITLGLASGAIVMARHAAALRSHTRVLAWTGLALVVATAAAGVLTTILKSNWWSYLMAVGFAVLFAVYGRLYRGNRTR